MGIDWEDILGEDLPLQEAYDRLLFGDGEEDPADRLDRILAGPVPEDDGRDEPVLSCDGNYPYCTGCCDDCRYCRSCSAAGGEDCDGRCWKCPHNQAMYWSEEDDALWPEDDPGMAAPGLREELPVDEFEEDEPMDAPAGSPAGGPEPEPVDSPPGEPADERKKLPIEEVERELI